MEGKIPSHIKPRRISASEAQIVAYLEQSGKTVFTALDVARLLGRSLDDPKNTKLLASLRRSGWIASLPLRGMYEFLPARSGTLSSGDAWTELRLLRSARPDIHAQVVLSSAAFLRGYAPRAPRRDVLMLDKTQSVRPKLRDTFRIIRTKPERLFGADDLNGLPVSTASRLVIECAVYWRHAGDLTSSDHWFAAAARDADHRLVRRWLKDHFTNATHAKVGYLAERFGVDELADALDRSVRTQVTILGAPPRKGLFDPRWRVYDTIGVAGRK